MMNMPQSRSLYALATLAGLIASALSLYLEYVLGYTPCPLCLSQRWVLMATTLTAGVAALHNAQGYGRYLYPGLMVLLSAAGGALAGRQLYLQGLPADQAPACLPDLSYLAKILPWQDLLGVMLSGTGDCAEASVHFLGLSLAGWTLICFLGFAALGLIQGGRTLGIHSRFLQGARS